MNCWRPPSSSKSAINTANPIAGVTVTFTVTARPMGSLSATTVTTDPDGQAKTTLTLGTDPGTNTIEANVEGIAQTATFNAIAELLEFDLSLSTGLNLIHLPLKVRAVDGMPTTIQSVSSLYTALGGDVNRQLILSTYDSRKLKSGSAISFLRTIEPRSRCESGG